MLQDPAPGGATYNSHAPQTGTNTNGLWLTLQDTETSAGGYGSTWSLYRSTNAGASWALYYRSGSYDGPPPSMHADRSGEVWVFQPTYAGTGLVLVHRFLPGTGQHDVISFASPSSAKHTSIYDPGSDGFYYLGQTGEFVVVDGNTFAVTRRTQMFSSGGGSGMAYPHMVLDGARLYVGGTVAGSGSVAYRDILAGYSDDTGVTVRDLAGTARSFPILFATGGGLTSLVKPEWLDQNAWLQRFAPLPGVNVLVGMYAVAGHHVVLGKSVPPAASPGSTVLLSDPIGGAAGQLNDGYGILVRDGSDLYAISGGAAPGVSRAILVMKWNGAGWDLVARSGEIGNDYAIAGPRKRVAGHPIVITLTDQRDNANRQNQRVLVLLFNP